MPPEERDPARIWHMIETARHAIRSLKGVPFNEFLTNIDLRDLAVYRIQLIGEAANQISSTLKSKHPEVAWRDIVDNRNALIHGYDRIEYDRVWDVIRNHLPTLLEQLERILKELDPERN